MYNWTQISKRKILFVGSMILILVIIIGVETNLGKKKEQIDKSEFQLVFENGIADQAEGLFKDAIEKFNRAYALLAENAQNGERMLCLLKLGLLSWNIGEIDKSYDYFNKAKRHEERVENRDKIVFCAKALEIIGLYNCGKKNREEGHELVSLDYFNKAISLSKDLRSFEFELKCTRQKSIAYWQLGDIENYFECSKVGLSIAKTINHKIEEGRCLNNIGVYYEIKKDYSRALDYFNLAIELARQADDHVGEAECLNNMGLLYVEVGEFERAIWHLRESLRIDQAIGDTSGTAIAASNIGSIYLDKYSVNKDKNDLYKALAFLELSISIEEEDIPEFVRIAAMNNLGVTNYELGKYEKAAVYLFKALNRMKSENLTEDKAKIGINIGSIFYNLKNIEKAKFYFNNSINLLSNGTYDSSKWEAYFGLGNCFEQVHNLNEAIRCYEKAIEHIEIDRHKISFDLFKVGFTKNKYIVYQRLIELLYAEYERDPSLNILMRMLFTVEKAKAQAFLETLNTDKGKISERLNQILHLSPDFTSRGLSMYSNLSKYENIQRFNIVFSEELERAKAEYLKSHSLLKMESKALINGGAMNYLDFEEIIFKMQNKDTVYLEYWLGENKSFLFYITKGTLEVSELAPQELIEKSIRGYLKAISSSPDNISSIINAGNRIAKELLGPILSLNCSLIRTIIICPDGILHYLPFESLLLNESSKSIYLIEKYRISYSPSLTVLRFLENNNTFTIHTKMLLAFGAPNSTFSQKHVDNDDSNSSNIREEDGKYRRQKYAKLPYSKGEVRNIARYFRKDKCDIYIGKNASAIVLKQLPLKRYQIIHFACHGIINDRYPLESSLVLSQNKKVLDDGLLKMREVYDLTISADLVVLSACNTAAGKIEVGAGIISLSRAFFVAGARSVVASLWTIKDSSAAKCMISFYNELSRRKDKSEALQCAKISMINSDRAHPYYWAGFVLSGEYNEAIY